MSAVILDWSAIVGIVGIGATVVTNVLTRRYDLRMFEKRIQVEREDAQVKRLHDAAETRREKMLVRYEARLRAYVDLFVADDRMLYLGLVNPSLEFANTLAELSPAYHAVRLLGPPEAAPVVVSMLNAQIDVVHAIHNKQPRAEVAVLQDKHGELTRQIAKILQDDLDALAVAGGIDEPKALAPIG
jgi:hypothetical protein